MTDWRTTRFWIALEQGAQLVALCIQRMNGGEVFVPKIPSMSIVNLTKALASQCEIEEIGIRPGEKLQEMLISEDEARQSLEFEEFYVVQPAHQWWGRDTWTGAQTLPEGFSYTSNNNTIGLDSSQMCSLAGDTE